MPRKRRGWRHSADIVRIDASLVAMASVQHPGEASMIHDRAFHVAVAGCLDNAVLVRVVGELFDQRLNPYFAKLAHYFENPESWGAALAEHQAIRDAIAAHDPEAARSDDARASGAVAGALCAEFRDRDRAGVARRGREAVEKIIDKRKWQQRRECTC